MKTRSLLTCLTGVVAMSALARAEGPPGPFDFQFVLPESASEGPIEILDATVQVFELRFDPASSRAPTEPIQYLELAINGFSHDSPMDVNIFLLPPFRNGMPLGNGLEILDDAGDQVSISDVDLVFTDKAGALPPMDTQLMSGSYLPVLGRFDQFYNGPILGTLPWTLVVIDDDSMEAGQIESVVLRGVVPEPATLSLLALGALAMLQRVRRRRA